MKRLLPVLAVLALCLAVLPAGAGNTTMQTYILFAGGNTDSTEQASRWIPVRGAERVIIRTWSNHVAFTATNADKAFTDSITTFKVLLSDSVQFLARDSLGTIVTARSAMSSVGAFPMCADSIMVDPTTASAANDSLAAVKVGILPINRALRAPTNASGLVTVVYPTTPGLATMDVKGTFNKDYLRIRTTPRRRLVGDTSESSTPTATNGLKGFMMVAYVYRSNQ